MKAMTDAQYVKKGGGPIFDSVDEYWAYSNDEVKRKALAKLTDLEKRALGLPL